MSFIVCFHKKRDVPLAKTIDDIELLLNSPNKNN